MQQWRSAAGPRNSSAGNNAPMRKLLQTRTATLIQTLSFIHIKSHAAFINTRPPPHSLISNFWYSMFQSSARECTQEITGIYLPVPTVREWCHWLRYSSRTDERLWKPSQLRFFRARALSSGSPPLALCAWVVRSGSPQDIVWFQSLPLLDVKWWGGNVIKPGLDFIVKQPRWKNAWQTAKALFNKNTHPIF